MDNDNTQIWEKRVTSKYGKKETPKQYNYFQKYLQQEGVRSVKRLHEELKSLGEKLGIKTISLKSLQSYCTDFDWVNRANAYDEYESKALLEEKQHNELLVSNKLAEFKLKELDNAKSYLEYSTWALQEAYKLYTNGEIDLNKYVKYMYTLAKAYDVALKALDTFESKNIDRIIINNQNGDNNSINAGCVTFHELMNEDLLKDLTDDIYLS